MKRISLVVIMLFVTLTFASCGSKKFKILLPTEYLAEELIASFQKEHGIKVKTVTFVSNEAAITRLKMEEFDLIVPSDYAVEQLIEEDLIDKIDWNKLDVVEPKTSFADPLVEVLEFYENDENPLILLDYMVPYFWGNLGIIYNKEVVSEEMLEEQQWGIFTDKNLKKAIYDSSRDAFFIALKQNGYSANTDDENELDIAKKYLEKIDASGKRVYLTDDILDDMQKRPPAFDVALVYGGDALYVKYNSDNENVGYYVPTIGTNIFIDGFVIPKTSRYVDLAYKFIDHVSKHDNGVINTIDVGYISAIKSVYEHMINDSNSEFYKFRDLYEIKFNNEVDELFRYVPFSKRYMDREWSIIRAK